MSIKFLVRTRTGRIARRTSWATTPAYITGTFREPWLGSAEIVGRRLRRAREGGGDEEKAKLRNVVKSA